MNTEDRGMLWYSRA